MNASWRAPVWARRLTVSGWVSLILVVMSVLVVGGSVVGATLLYRGARMTDSLTDAVLPASASAYQLQAALIDQETGVRGFALTGVDSFLDPYRDGLLVQQQAADRIRDLLGDHPDLLEDLAAIERAAAVWQATVADAIVEATPDNAVLPNPGAYERGKLAFDNVRALFDQQNLGLAEAVDDAQAQLGSMRTLRNSVFTALAIVMMGTVGLIAVLARVAVTRPLGRLAASSRLVAHGDFDHGVDAGQGPADIRAVASDIEEMRRRIVAELDAVRDRQERLEEQTRQLDAQTVELKRSNADLEQFAYVASHDLQEPLRKVASFCQLLEKRYGDELDDRGRQYIDFAVDGARRMQTLINDLLTFSRVGRVGDAVERLSLGATLDKALGNLAAVLEETGARIERPEQRIEIDGDPALLSMLWQNLIGNAIKFTEPGTVPHVVITAERDGAVWRICVQDNGIGVPPEFAEKIFVIFQRLHAREAYQGTGIGLALCKKIVEFHGGTIGLDTDYTTGARFCFTLPAADDPTTTIGGPRS